MKSTLHLLIFLLFIFSYNLMAQPAASGVESIVNSTIANSQLSPAVAMDANGNYVIVWESYGQDASNTYGIYFQRYNSSGAVQGSETLVNTTTSDSQQFPDIAMDDNGDFVVVWMSNNQDGDGWGVYFQRYNSSGVAQGSETRANTATVNEQRHPRVAMDSDGDFVIVWASENQDGDNYGVYFQRYNSAGAAQGSETLANTTTTNFQGYPAVSMDASGNFVIAWQSLAQDGSGNGVYAQRFTSAGATQGSEFLVNTTTTQSQQEPDVDMNPSGAFVIVWSSYTQDGSGDGIYFQKYTSAGATDGSETIVNTTTSDDQVRPSVAILTNGAFVIIWSSYSQDGNFMGNYLQAYNTNNASLGSETLVNTRTTDFQQNSDIAIYDDNTTMVTTWQDGLRSSTSTNDTDNYGIYTQRFTLSGFVPVELLSFEATALENQTALLEWSTLSERNNEGFYVERAKSSTSSEWKTLGFVDGGGDSDELLRYEFVDQSPHIGVNYYRLKQVDYDGLYDYSDIRSVSFSRAGKVFLSPNPASEMLNIEVSEFWLESGSLEVVVFNCAGQKVRIFDMPFHHSTYQIGDLTPGLYAIGFYQDGKHMAAERFVKTN